MSALDGGSGALSCVARQRRRGRYQRMLIVASPSGSRPRLVTALSRSGEDEGVGPLIKLP